MNTVFLAFVAIYCCQLASVSCRANPQGGYYNNRWRRWTTTPPPLFTTKNSIIDVFPADLPGSSEQESNESKQDELCPRSATSEYRFDVDAQVCSRINQQSHCGKNMIFYAYADNKVYGHCDCNYNTAVPLVYHQDTHRCYYVYQQAYCKAGEWLQLNRKAQPVCSENKCYDFGRSKFGQKPLASRDDMPEYVPLKGNGPCVQLNKSSKYCKNKNEIVKFRLPKQFYPSCGVPGPTVRILSVVGTFKCSPGTYLSVLGHCQPDFDFDF